MKILLENSKNFKNSYEKMLNSRKKIFSEKVDKQVRNHQTVITAYQLTEEDRVSELARMQGDKTAQAAMAYARELLDKR